MTTNPLSPAEQIAAINRKRADDHRCVDMQHDQLIQIVRGRCVHEAEIPDWFFNEAKKTQLECKNICKHCGAPMGAESNTDNEEF